MTLQKTLRAEWKMLRTMFATNMKDAASLRLSFALQIIGMMLNNCSFILIWVFFFHAFGAVNGWSTIEVIGLEGFASFVFGVCFTFAAGVSQLPDALYNGKFDALLLSPRNLYLRLATNALSISAIGDMLLGLGLIIAFLAVSGASLLQWLVCFTVLPAAVLIIVNVAYACALLAFAFADGRDVARNAFEIFFAPSLYPAGLFQGGVRFFFTFILPSLTIAGLPVEIIRNLDYRTYIAVWCIALFWLTLVLFCLPRAIRHYESGNLTGAR